LIFINIPAEAETDGACADQGKIFPTEEDGGAFIDDDIGAVAGFV